MTTFRWTRKRSKAAVLLAEGYTEIEAAAAVGVSSRTVQRWKHDTEFAVEIDRLSLMVDISGKAYRMRLAMKRVRAILAGIKAEHKPDNLLDWLRYAQGETDGVKLDLTNLLAALNDNDSSLASAGSDGVVVETQGDQS